MSKYKVVAEHDDCFEVEDSKGRFKVAKKGLSKKTLAAAQKLYKGGKVQEMASGGVAGDEDGDGIPDTIDQPEPDLAAIQAGIASAQAPLPVPAQFGPAPLAPHNPNVPPQSFTQGVSTTVPSPEEQALSTHQPPPGYDPTIETPPTPAPQSQPQPQPQQAMDPRSALGTMGIAGSGLPAGYDAALAKQKRALQMKAEAEAREAATQEAIRADQLRRGAEIEAAGQAKLAEVEKEGEQLKQDIAESKIDPKRLYSSMGTGNKLLGAIGMLLTGAGGGDPMAIINKSIDRDIEAQKENLAGKNNLLAYNMKKTGDIKQATAQTKLDLLNSVEVKLKQVASVAQGENAKAAALAGMAALDQQRAMLKAQLAQAAAVQFATVQETTAKSQALDRLYRGEGQPQDRAFLSEAEQKALVHSPWGGLALATNPDQSSEYNKISVATRQFNDMLNQLETIATKHTNLTPSDRAVYNSLMTEIGVMWSKKNGMGAWDNGTANAVASVLPNGANDLLSYSTPASRKAIIDRLRASTRQGFNNATKQYVILYPESQPKMVQGKKR